MIRACCNDILISMNYLGGRLHTSFAFTTYPAPNYVLIQCSRSHSPTNYHYTLNS